MKNPRVPSGQRDSLSRLRGLVAALESDPMMLATLDVRVPGDTGMHRFPVTDLDLVVRGNVGEIHCRVLPRRAETRLAEYLGLNGSGDSIATLAEIHFLMQSGQTNNAHGLYRAEDLKAVPDMPPDQTRRLSAVRVEPERWVISVQPADGLVDVLLLDS